MERRFQVWDLPLLHSRIRVLAPVAALASVAFIRSDPDFVSSPGALYSLSAARMSLTIVSIALFLVANRIHEPRIFEATVFAWTVAVVAMALFSSSTRPPTYLTYIALDVAIVMGAHAFVPVRWPLQLVPGLLLTLGDVWLLEVARESTDVPSYRVFLTALVVANLMGIGVSWTIQLSRRQAFRSLTQEIETREFLEKTVAEVRTLRGIVPICAKCKKIRDDRGYWQQVEVYVRDRTHADFTHGLCPDCLVEMEEED